MSRQPPIQIGTWWRMTPDTKRDIVNVYMVVGKVGSDYRMRLMVGGDIDTKPGHEMTVDRLWFTVRGWMPATSPGAVRQVPAPNVTLGGAS